MTPSERPNAPNDWASAQLKGISVSAPPATGERREWSDRRRRVWWSVVYGSFNPRRRAPPRRLNDSRYQAIDWHSAHLLVVAIGILLLSVADAFMTVALLAGGAVEVNPVMAALIYRSSGLFAGLKMAMTGIGVTLMVFLASHRFFRVLRVEIVLYVIFVGYVGLLSYEYWLLHALFDLN